jgi:RNA-directed DNA polymerase
MDTLFSEVVEFKNLHAAYRAARMSKRYRDSILKFGFRIEENLTRLQHDLEAGQYAHGRYREFIINDSKKRLIKAAPFRDRVVHHAVCNIIEPILERTFISDSFACRKGKGSHAAVKRLESFMRSIRSTGNIRTYCLKCDIRKFFANINHGVLIEILKSYIPDQRIIALLEEVIGSFSTTSGVGLPLGNLTSQLFVNVYMNEFDQFAKHVLRAKHYLRYADDFTVLSTNREWLEIILPEIRNFLINRLRLELHSNKVSIKTLASGVDILGWVHFPDHHVLRTTTKRRAIVRVTNDPNKQRVASYVGMLKHGNAEKIKGIIINITREAAPR